MMRRILSKAILFVWAISVSFLQTSGQAAETNGVNSNLRGGEVHQRSNDDGSDGSVLCRITVFESFSISESNAAVTSKRVVCVPIVGVQESDFEFPVDLPQDLYEQYEEEIEQGKLILSISNANLVDNKLEVGTRPVFTVVTNPSFQRHYERHLAVKATMTVAVIRISTSDSSPKDSVGILETTHFGGGINFSSQYEACSSGKLKWTQADVGVLDVKIPNKISEFSGDYMSLVTAVQMYMKAELGFSSVSSIADKVIMCLPPGTGKWAGSASVGHWRVQLNNDWCLSLSATMHELGHTLGLMHAGKGGNEYGDLLGYMGSSYTNAYWPQKCFNGLDLYLLNWFGDRSLKHDPLHDGDAIIKLATFVDYNKTAVDEYVVVDLVDAYYLQYNVAKAFNKDTQAMQNQVAITEPSPKGSNSLAGLIEGDSYKISNFMSSGNNLWVEACAKVIGQDGALVMIVSIAMDKSLCGTDRMTALTKPAADVATAGPHATSTTTKAYAQADSTLLAWFFGLLLRLRK